MTRPGEEGVVLVNVLVILAIASALIVLMLDTQDLALDRARQMASASAADALARGAEASVITALRRDMAEAPGSDHRGEDWATGQMLAELETGSFSVEVFDAQAKLDLNRLRSGAPADAQLFARLFAALDAPVAELRRVALELAGRPDVSGLSQLDSLSSETRRLLAPHVDILPRASALNINTASPLLVELAVNNASATTRLLAIRGRAGKLDAEDLARVGVVLPPGVGFTSNTFDVSTSVEVDGTRVDLESRILRDTSGGVRVVRRRYGTDNAVPPPPSTLAQ